MDWFPLLNSLRIAAISTVLVFFLGILCAYYVARLPRVVKGVLDVILTLPLVLPPTVMGYFLLRLMGPRRPLGLSNTYIFWRIRMPCCRQGILAGTVLSFARALGEYGATSMIAGYTPGRTATISTTVYQLWRTGNDAEAFRWVLVNLAISTVVLLCINLLERRERRN